MNALVNAFERLHMVRGEKSGYSGSKVQAMYLRQQTAERFELTVNESRIEDQLGAIIGDLRLSQAFNLALHRFEVPLDAVHANSKRVNQG